MAILRKYTVQEALNIDVAAKWDVQTALSVNDSYAHATESICVTDTANGIDYHQVAIDVGGNDEVYFSFGADKTVAPSVSTDMQLANDSLTFVKIPKGIGDLIYLKFICDTGEPATVKVVLM